MTISFRQASYRRLTAIAVDAAASLDWPIDVVGVPPEVNRILVQAAHAVWTGVDLPDPDWSSYRFDGSLTAMSPEEIRVDLHAALYEALRKERKKFVLIAGTLQSARDTEAVRKYQAVKALERGKQRREDIAEHRAERLAREAAHALIGAKDRALEQARLKAARIALERSPGYVRPPVKRESTVCGTCGAPNQHYRLCTSCRRVR